MAQNNEQIFGYGAGAEGGGTRGTPGEGRAAGGEGLGELVTGLLRDLQDLVRAEFKLAKAELREDAAAAGRGVALIVAGGLVGLVGFSILMLAVTYLLNRWVRLWIAAGIVAVALLVIALILVSVGRGRLKAANLAPEQTIETLKEDKEWASQRINFARR